MKCYARPFVFGASRKIRFISTNPASHFSIADFAVCLFERVKGGVVPFRAFPLLCSAAPFLRNRTGWRGWVGKVTLAGEPVELIRFHRNAFESAELGFHF